VCAVLTKLNMDGTIQYICVRLVIPVCTAEIPVMPASIRGVTNTLSQIQKYSGIQWNFSHGTTKWANPDPTWTFLWPLKQFCQIDSKSITHL
jgi:hypothetical protein